ncbi:hypothetical protein An05g01460 [Aspergillus niger]|uniref:Uncharacterized protein n=2 Tax=Aspergillus niger TaxID=5061 RepID=A2QKU8_ASPNC|nr:hypothetical protein An05g01460 [Aspergillus niger]CAK96485.1 hypothetical protein An05g01460 [Aspergillus niger]
MGGGLLHILLKVMASSSEFPGSSNAWRQPVLLCINLSAVYGSFQCGLKRHHAARDMMCCVLYGSPPDIISGTTNITLLIAAEPIIETLVMKMLVQYLGSCLLHISSMESHITGFRDVERFDGMVRVEIPLSLSNG